MNIKVLGSGCPSCLSMYNDVTRAVERNGWNATVEYVRDIEKILSYGVMGTPVLVINEKVVMVGHHGARRIEQALQKAGAVINAAFIGAAPWNASCHWQLHSLRRSYERSTHSRCALRP